MTDIVWIPYYDGTNVVSKWRPALRDKVPPGVDFEVDPHEGGERVHGWEAMVDHLKAHGMLPPEPDPQEPKTVTW